MAVIIIIIIIGGPMAIKLAVVVVTITMTKLTVSSQELQRTEERRSQPLQRECCQPAGSH